MIRDHIICGIQDNSLRHKLLAKANVDFEACVKECKSAEAGASKDQVGNEFVVEVVIRKCS